MFGIFIRPGVAPPESDLCTISCFQGFDVILPGKKLWLTDKYIYVIFFIL